MFVPICLPSDHWLLIISFLEVTDAARFACTDKQSLKLCVEHDEHMFQQNKSHFGFYQAVNWQGNFAYGNRFRGHIGIPIVLPLYEIDFCSFVFHKILERVSIEARIVEGCRIVPMKNHEFAFEVQCVRSFNGTKIVLCKSSINTAFDRKEISAEFELFKCNCGVAQNLLAESHLMDVEHWKGGKGDNQKRLDQHMDMKPW